MAGVSTERAVGVGLLTGAVGGLTGLISGCPLQVIGPASGAAVMYAALTKELGPEEIGLVCVLAGLIQILSGAFRLGPVFRAASPALIQGMLGGIGLLIFVSEFHVMVDDTPPGISEEFGGIINLVSLPKAIWKGLTEPAHRHAAIAGICTIAVIVLWERFAPKRLKIFPAAFVGFCAGMTVAHGFGLDVKLAPSPGGLADIVTLPTSGALARITQAAVWTSALSLAFVTGAKSLLAATAVDQMRMHGPRTHFDRELAAIGVANLICGLLGLLPVAGIVLRGSANVMAGAKTRLSAILQGIWTLLLLILFPTALSQVPLGVLAAVLVYSGAKLIKLGFVRTLWGEDRAEAILYAITLTTVVITDVLTGIALGVALATARVLYVLSHLEISVESSGGVQERIVHLKGAATFLRLPQLAKVLEEIDPKSRVKLDISNLTFIDHASLDLLLSRQKQHGAAGGEFELCLASLKSSYKRML
jgi:MFS superfamily sulfate permease-like transporter